MFRHKHEWRTIARSFTPGVNRVNQVEVRGYEGIIFFERMVRGFTSVTQRCESCGRVAVDEYIGNVIIPLDN